MSDDFEISQLLRHASGRTIGIQVELTCGMWPGHSDFLDWTYEVPDSLPVVHRCL